MRTKGIALTLCAMFGGARGQESSVSEGYANPDARRSFRVMALDGTPLPGAVMAFVPAVHNVPPRTRADAKGVATADLVEEWPVAFEMPGYMPRRFGNAHEIPDEGVYLAPTGTIAGRVTNAIGEPLFGIDVRIEDEASGFVASTRSDEGGRFAFEGEVLAPAVLLTIPDDHYVTVRRRVLAGARDVAIVLRPGARVHGVVMRSDGSIDEGAVVEGFRCVKGRFEAAGLAPGKYAFRGRDSRGERIGSGERLLDGGEATAVTLQASTEPQESEYSEWVQVLAPTGESLEGRRVWVEGRECRVDSRGLVAAPASWPAHDQIHVRVESLAGSPGADLRLPRTSTMRDWKQPDGPQAPRICAAARIPRAIYFPLLLEVEATVTLIEPDGMRTPQEWRKRDALLAADPLCEYAIEIERPGLPRLLLDRWRPPAEGVPLDIIPALDPVRCVLGRFVIGAGEPLGHADVRCTTADRHGWRTQVETRTDRLGQFLLAGLPPGRVTLEVSYGGSPLGRFESDAEGGLKLGDLAVARPRRYRGRIVGAGANVLLSVMPRGQVAQTDATGGFALDVPSSAPFWLLAECDGFAATHLDPAANELRLEPACSAVVKITPPGQGALQVDVAPEGTDRWRQVIDDPTGDTAEHTLSDLPPGPLRFRLRRGEIVLETVAEETVTFELRR